MSPSSHRSPPASQITTMTSSTTANNEDSRRTSPRRKNTTLNPTSTLTHNVCSCDYKTCIVADTNETKLNCVGTGCHKRFHKSCLTFLLCRAKWLDKDLLGENAVCSKTCYNKFIVSATKKRTWTNDGANGVDDPQTSERILLDWLMAEGNYSKKWRGNSKGKKKKHVAAEIALLMNAAKVQVVRDAKQVMNKISHIEKAFRAAHDFANTETGQGLKENDTGEFDDAVRRKCLYYFDLLEIFGDRASAKPKVTSLDNLSSSDDENDNEDDDSSSNGYSDDDDNDEHNMATNILDTSFESNNILDSSFEINDDDDIILEVTKKSKRKSSTSSLSLAGSAASKKTAKGNKVISLLDEDANRSYASLATVQEQFYKAKLDAATTDSINKKTQNEQLDLQLRMQKFEMLQSIRKQQPELSNEEIVTLFPGLAEFVKLINTNKTK
jgi:hypothetical protein